MSLFRSRLALSSALAFLFTVPILAAEEPGFTPLFNGKDLAGWEGDPALWSVQDGAITGVTTDDAPLPYNKFLIWRGGTVKNFELHAKVRQTGNNSGIQYRSRELKEVGPWSVGGYQCDIHPLAVNNAMLYDERGRGIVAMNGQSVIVDEKGAKWLTKQRDPVTVDVAEWNEYTIIARGNQLTHKLNGQVTVEIIDHQADQRELEGILAIQVHRGPAMRVQIKDVMLKTLPDGGVLSPAEAPVPPDAKPLGKPATPKKAATPKKVAAVPVPAPPTPPAAPVAKAAAKARRERPATGLAIGENKATPLDRVKVAKDFKAELVYSVPIGDQGSWVNLCLDDKGRILASDQYGGLYRFPPPPPGQPLDPATIEPVPAAIRAVNGMIWAFGALYVAVNDYEKKIASGLYRAHRLRRRRPARQGRAAPVDGGAGRSRRPCAAARARRQVALPRHRQWDQADRSSAARACRPSGARTICCRGCPMAAASCATCSRPAGSSTGSRPTARTSRSVSIGLPQHLRRGLQPGRRAVHLRRRHGVRLQHAVVPADARLPRGQRQRVRLAQRRGQTARVVSRQPPGGRRTSARVRRRAWSSATARSSRPNIRQALFILDWSWGKLYAIHLEPEGATYRGVKEEFLSGAPLPLTDALVHPADGAMYFTIGGRKVQSGLYRVTYVGNESTAPVTARHRRYPAEHQLRHRLEAYHGKVDPRALDEAWPHLGHPDRCIRWAARTAVEHQPATTWADRALAETDPATQLEALLALARVTGIDPFHRKPTDPPVDRAMQGRILEALLRLDWDALSQEQRITPRAHATRSPSTASAVPTMPRCNGSSRSSTRGSRPRPAN